jgi:hypothetical protein
VGTLVAAAAEPTTIAASSQAVEIRVDAAKGRLPISPCIYGRNNYDNVNKMDPQLVRDLGLRMLRDSVGNNCTKYNWRCDLSSHPDWYNNVYPQGLQKRAALFDKDFGQVQMLYGLPVLGWVAKEGGDKVNFSKNDNKPGPIDPPAGKNLCGDGKIETYLEKSTPKDAVDMLDHWFKPGGLGLNPKHFLYFHLDNEPEGWSTTHDDVCPKPMTGEEAVQKFVAVAKELKTRYPEVRVLAPGFMAEWFWWNWSDHKAVAGLPWMQYFVKRMGEESKTFGKPLIDVVDFHTYISGEAKDAETLQEWRVFYDPNYDFPRANGCKIYPDGQHHENQHVECVFGRMEGWLNDYFGKGHKVGIGITECGPGRHPPMVLNLWYASMLGTYSDHGVEVFTPWEWHDCWWEVMHLFSRYARETRVETTSSDPNMVLAYASVNAKGDGMTVIFLNMEKSAARTAKVSLAGFAAPAGDQPTLTLTDVTKDTMTVKSHTDNALKKAAVTVKDGAFELMLPPYSITAVVLGASPDAATAAK